MKKFTTTTALMLALSSSGLSAQSFNTNCTRDYFGNISCRTAPERNNDTSLNELRQIIETPMPTLRGIDPAHTAAAMQRLREANAGVGDFQVQTGSTIFPFPFNKGN